MESTLDRAAQSARTQITKMRWALGINGALSITVGVLMLVWPGISLYALTIVFGAFAFTTGLVGLVAAFRSPAGNRGWLILSSLLGIAVGMAVLVWPDMSALALLYVIGVYAVALGFIAIYGAFWLPLDGGDTALMALSGLVAILFGIVIFAKPGAGALALLALIAAFALVTGLIEVAVAIGGQRMVESRLKKTFRLKPQTT
jgi:uncharacterized membrane protein HdeD (DUF308 family)